MLSFKKGRCTQNYFDFEHREKTVTTKELASKVVAIVENRSNSLKEQKDLNESWFNFKLVKDHFVGLIYLALSMCPFRKQLVTVNYLREDLDIYSQKPQQYMRQPRYSTFSTILPNTGRLMYLPAFRWEGSLPFWNEDTFQSNRRYVPLI